MAFKDEEIAEVIEQSTDLPLTHRPGYHGERDDVAKGPNGEPIHVPTPETPEDRY